MENILSAFVDRQGKKEIFDPVTEEWMILQAVGQEVQWVHRAAGTETRSVLQVEELKERMLPIYERFHENLPCYLKKIREEQKDWRFFDVAFGVDIVVQGRFGEKGFECWEIWMGEDLSFASDEEEEVIAYLRGLVVQFDSWVLNQLFAHFHEHLIERSKF